MNLIQLLLVIAITIISVIKPAIRGMETNKKGYKCIDYKIYSELSEKELERATITSGMFHIY